MFSPAVTVSVAHSSVYPCDSDSVIRQISYSKTVDQSVTCNGIIVNGPRDESYDIIISKPSKWGHGNSWGGNYGGGNYGETIKTTLKLTNYTDVYTYNNGKFTLDTKF